MKRLLAASLVAAGALSAGCAKLDGLMYLGEVTDAYVLDPTGSTPEETVTPERIEPFTLTTEDGMTLGAVLVKGSVQPPRAWVLFFHGRSDHIDGHFARTKRWANLGYDVLVFDYRGFGISTNVTPSEAGLARDTQAAWEWLQRRIGSENAGKVVFYGHSLGTATSTQQAVRSPPAVLVLESGFASVEEHKRDSTRLDLPYGFYARDSWDTVGRLPSVPAAVLVLHGTEDQVFRPEYGRQLYEAANDPKHLELVAGAGHDDLPQVLGAHYPALVTGFIQRHLGSP